jgi:nicotinamide riboside transporter PnuC
MEEIGWILSGISIAGGILNALRHKVSFYIWMVANIGWIIYFSLQGIYYQLPLWIVYTGICILGIIQWTKKEKQDDKKGG